MEKTAKILSDAADNFKYLAEQLNDGCITEEEYKTKHIADLDMYIGRLQAHLNEVLAD